MLSHLTAQSLYRSPEWLLPPEQLSFTPTSVSSSTTSVPSGAYDVSNAAFDESGNLLFYVQDGDIHDASSTPITFFPSSDFPNGVPNPEVAICPKPGTCDQYYVFSWGAKAFIGTDLDFATVTVSSGGTVNVSSVSTLTSGNVHCNGIAVSKPINASMDRHLYAVTSGRVDRFLIENSGVSFDVTIASGSDLSSYGVAADDTPEAELAGNCVAWGSLSGSLGAPEAYIAVFDLSSGALDNIFTLTLPDENLRVAGLEFGDRGRRLYVSAFIYEGDDKSAEGVYYFDAEEEFQVAHKVLVSEEIEELYSRTHIERGRNERFYLVSESGKLSYFEQGVDIIKISSLGLTVPSFGDFITGSFYTLPDQNDDDDYSSFTGYPAALITDLDVNGLSVDPSLPTLPEFFTCNSLTMNTVTSGVNEYRISLRELNPNGSTVLRYLSGETIGAPGSNIDMKNFPPLQTGGFGDPEWLDDHTHTGKYEIKLQVFNQCNAVNTEVGEFRYSAPTDLVINSIGINGDILAPDVPPVGPQPLDVYDCDPLLLNVNATGAEHRIWVYQVNPATGAQVVTTGAMDYTPSAWLPGPPAQVDLLTLIDQAGVSLTNNPNSYAVEVWVRDECNSPAFLSRKGQFKMNSDPNANTVTMRLGPAAPPFPPSGGLQMPSQNIASPVLQGTSGEVDVSNSAGLITYYRVNIDEVDCSTGAITGSILQGSNVQLTRPNNTSELENIGYNAVTYDGTYGYFNNPANNVIGKCYRVEVWVGNVCGEASDWSYIQFNGNYRLANPTRPNAEDARATLMSVKIWPNPASSKALVEYELPAEGMVRLDLLDAHGRLVAVPMKANLTAGTHRSKIDLTQLPAGVYQWRMVAGQKVQQGRLIKQ